ncbi:Protein MEF2BNB-like protein [Operophtera brumata]|uniref:Protein MEF2BNB-like protein n=1 Tax=Operophtera brumata TaxID=104452 RepID=A0A0L7L1V4_OPEBR|nr:Protein MEF2BNB-like protein [Operophtera brumata]
MAFVYQGDQELESKAKKAAERISENMHIVANEPSLALYRLQEHVRKALPPMVERRVESMDGAATSFKNIQGMLKQSIFLKQQLKYEESRRNKKDSNSVYKRLSAHIVLDLPDLSEFSMVRETTNRIENIMAQARGSTNELHRSHTTLH